jgi:hypothetical protein
LPVRIWQLPKVLKDSLEAFQTSLPHAQKAAEANREALELELQLNDPSSCLSEQEKVVMRRRAAELWDQVRRENQVAELPYEKLRARHPDWIE